jgi:hypothetical protein
MKEFRINHLNRSEVELWCHTNIGPGGFRLREFPGCQGFEDYWDGDEWGLLYKSSGPVIEIKDDAKVVLFTLRWS